MNQGPKTPAQFSQKLTRSNGPPSVIQPTKTTSTPFSKEAVPMQEFPDEPSSEPRSEQNSSPP